MMTRVVRRTVAIVVTAINLRHLGGSDLMSWVECSIQLRRMCNAANNDGRTVSIAGRERTQVL
jgi:hypothetical protein